MNCFWFYVEGCCKNLLEEEFVVITVFGAPIKMSNDALV